MYYSCISILALIIHLIINWESIKNVRLFGKAAEAGQKAALRYSYFLLASVLYFIADIGWGLLYEHHDIPELFPILYSDCVFYFLFMLLTMLTWFRYIVSYLDKKRRRNKALLYAVWLIFTLGLIYLMINHFYPFIFSFNEAHEYVMEPGRYIAFILQILMYVVTSTYMVYIAFRSYRQERVRYFAVGVTCIVLELFLFLQIFNPSYPFYAMGIIVGTCIVHSFVEAGEKKEREIYDNIINGLADDYEAMFYIDIESGEYFEFATSEEYRSLNVPVEGKDFYSEARESTLKYVYPDDYEFARSLYYKEKMIRYIEGKRSFAVKYRIMVNGEPRFFLFTLMYSSDKKHFILTEKDIQDNISAENERKENQNQQITFSRIAESLASNYDMIYYVDAVKCDYVCYKFNNIFGQLEMNSAGEDFFGESRKNIPQIIHEEDRERLYNFINRDNMISFMEDRKTHSIDYRLSIEGKTRYARMTVRKTGDGSHFIIGVENVDAEVKKEKEQLKALNTEKELARRDELTGVKNKTAYMELEKSVQANLDNGMDYLPFALLVCDTNDLKKINDTEGHVAGDEYLKASAKLLCDTFTHSPVFRVGGDEFVVFLRGDDYTERLKLMEKIRSRVLANKNNASGPILAVGMAEFEQDSDNLVSEIFERADKEMYEEKRRLKES